MLKLRSLFQSQFARNVSVLASGTVVAQALAILALPFLTRLYTPSDFGVLAVFAALLGLISVVAGMRYEVAIPLPESDEKAANLCAVAMAMVVATTIAVAAFLIPMRLQVALWMNNAALAAYLWLLPVAVLTSGMYNVFQMWATRRQAFRRIARTRVEQSVGGVGVQLLAGWFGLGPIGLIAGQVVGGAAGCIHLARRAIDEDQTAFSNIRRANMVCAAREYNRFPKFSAVEALTNAAGFQIPLMVIAALSTAPELGFLMLAIRITQAPMGLIGASISQVYFSSAIDELRQGRLSDFTGRMIGRLAKIGVGPLIFGGMVAPVIFGPLFGPAWHRAGEIVAVMTPWFVLQFLVSPVSMVLHVTNNQRQALTFQVAGLVLRVLMVWAGGNVFGGRFLIGVFAGSGCAFYLVYLWLVCRVAGIPIRALLRRLKGSLPFVLGWAVLGLAVRITIMFR